MTTYDLHTMNLLVAEDRLQRQNHPTLPLFIYKYTVETQFGRQWDDITTRARGLVLDDKGVAWSNPIPKFHNVEELESLGVKLPEMPYEIYEKLDGSCIEVFWYNDNLVVCTLGSFQSDQAKIAEEIIHQRGWTSKFDKGKTYIFELLVPENRIVIDYGDTRELVLLAIRDNEFDTVEYDLSEGIAAGFPVVQKIGMTLEEVMTEKKRADFVGKEGFVVKFQNGFRVKVKYEEYFRLHKIMTGVSKHFVWDYLKDGKVKEEMLVNVPDEFFRIVANWDAEIRGNYFAVELSARNTFDEIKVGANDRKEFASRALQRPYPSILFKMYEGRPYSDLIWRIIEPKGEDAVKFNSFKGDA